MKTETKLKQYKITQTSRVMYRTQNRIYTKGIVHWPPAKHRNLARSCSLVSGWDLLPSGQDACIRYRWSGRQQRCRISCIDNHAQIHVSHAAVTNYTQRYLVLFQIQWTQKRIRILSKSNNFPTSESVGCTETIFGQIPIWFCIKK